MSSQPRSIFEVLPTDILDLVVGEVRGSDFGTLRDLRLVCKQFNELVEPLAFGSLTIMPRKELDAFQSQLNHLASGRSPNSRWTKRLSIGHTTFIPFVNLPVGYEGPLKDAVDDELKRLNTLAIQKEKLARAIEALQRVTSVSYHAKEEMPYEVVFGAVARLPKLEKISIWFLSGFEEGYLPLTKFSNLREIELVYPRFFPSVVAAIREMLVASSTTLGSVTIKPYEWNREFRGAEPSTDTRSARVIGLGALLEAPGDTGAMPKKDTVLARLSNPPCKQTPSHPKATPQYPRLKKVATNADRITLSGNIVPLLPSLTHLDITHASSRNIEDSFWKALMNGKVRLEHLEMWPLTTPVVEYLLSYSGLKTIHLVGVHGNNLPMIKNTDDCPVFSEVLPRHSRTLEKLWLQGSVRRGYNTLTQKILDTIGRCSELRELRISYPFPASGEDQGPEAVPVALIDPTLAPTTQGPLLSHLAKSLPRLTALCFEPIRQEPPTHNPQEIIQHHDQTLEDFVQAVSQSDLAGTIPTYSISIGGTGRAKMQFDRQTRKFVGSTSSHWPLH
ncbi:hypothetical protein NMY22_g8553 [Coprinellus aureogranulatus]|nr:hypothetical protein NMY22_g8553 [Coprinellus aureogranulatus]